MPITHLPRGPLTARDIAKDLYAGGLAYSFDKSATFLSSGLTNQDSLSDLLKQLASLEALLKNAPPDFKELFPEKYAALDSLINYISSFPISVTINDGYGAHTHPVNDQYGNPLTIGEYLNDLASGQNPTYSYSDPSWTYQINCNDLSGYTTNVQVPSDADANINFLYWELTE